MRWHWRLVNLGPLIAALALTGASIHRWLAAAEPHTAPGYPFSPLVFIILAASATIVLATWMLWWLRGRHGEEED